MRAWLPSPEHDLALLREQPKPRICAALAPSFATPAPLLRARPKPAHASRLPALHPMAYAAAALAGSAPTPLPFSYMKPSIAQLAPSWTDSHAWVQPGTSP